MKRYYAVCQNDTHREWIGIFHSQKLAETYAKYLESFTGITYAVHCVELSLVHIRQLTTTEDM